MDAINQKMQESKPDRKSNAFIIDDVNVEINSLRLKCFIFLYFILDVVHFVTSICFNIKLFYVSNFVLSWVPNNFLNALSFNSFMSDNVLLSCQVVRDYVLIC